MRIGLIARADDRGLGIQTWEWFRHMDPVSTLVVDMSAHPGSFPMHLDRFEQGDSRVRVVKYEGDQLVGGQMVRDFLDEVDVVYTAETFYDMRIADWAKDQGTKVCVHVNPEFWKYDGHNWPAIQWWSATTWRKSHLPRSTRIVPVPVPLDRWPEPAAETDEARFLHVAGHLAAHDRNGTRAFIAGAKQVRNRCRIRVTGQDGRLPGGQTQPGVKLESIPNGVENYWDIYKDCNVLVLPRRYGGLCLPANEACGAGLALVMPDVSPNMTWPIVPLRPHTKQFMKAPGGKIELTGTDYTNIAQVMDRLANDREYRWQHQRLSRMWAEAHSWDAQKHNIIAALES